MEFGRITHIFQIPLSWFKRIDRRANLITDGNTLEKEETDEGVVLKIADGALPSKEVGTAIDKRDANPDDYQGWEDWEWQAGGANGIKLDVYCRVEKSSGWHYLSRATITISKDGLITNIKANKGEKEIQA